MKKVKHILKQKGHALWYVRPDDTVYNAIKLMDDKGVGALAVVVGDSLIGIISERDYARKVILKNRSSKETKVKEIMTRQVIYTFPDQDIEECLAIMTRSHIRHLPVIHNGEIEGMVSMGDVVKEIISEQRYTIVQLEQTIIWEETY
jgi:CBS domain-containing protein